MLKPAKGGKMTGRRPMRVLCGIVGCALLGGGLAAATPARPLAVTQPAETINPADVNPADVGAVGAGEKYYPTDGNGGYRPSDYHIAIDYDPASRHLDGDAVITARATQPLRRFDFDLTGLTVRSVSVDGKPATFATAGQHELVITAAKTLATGQEFVVRVRYDGVPEADNDPRFGPVGWQHSTTGGAFVAGEPHSASTWYPVDDSPRDKASFAVDATVPAGWSVIANGRDGGSTPAGNGRRTFHWAEPTPIASYLTTVAIDKWTYQRSTLPDGTPVISAFAPGTTRAQALEKRLPEILAFEESKFGKYPQDAAGGIFVAANMNFSLETQTRPIYANWVDLTTIVHENAHQWFGDDVTVENWADICLNECFASYAQ
ncbi:MAG: M1 family metallopeptidase, partial [Sciscionella sp.]|nr:M1 family metallopeptidase [Sciscionella sp.]